MNNIKIKNTKKKKTHEKRIPMKYNVIRNIKKEENVKK
jgi:hypothetical protein